MPLTTLKIVSILGSLCLFLTSCGDRVNSNNEPHAEEPHAEDSSSLHAVNDESGLGVYFVETINKVSKKNENQFIICRRASKETTSLWKTCHPLFYDFQKQPVFVHSINTLDKEFNLRESFLQALKTYEKANNEFHEKELANSLADSVQKRDLSLLAFSVGIGAYIIRKIGVERISKEFNVSTQEFLKSMIDNAEFKGFKLRASAIRNLGIVAIGTGVALVWANKYNQDKFLKRITQSQQNLLRLQRRNLTYNEARTVEYVPFLFEPIEESTVATQVENLKKMIPPLLKFLTASNLTNDISYYCLTNPANGGFAANCHHVSLDK